MLALGTDTRSRAYVSDVEGNSKSGGEDDACNGGVECWQTTGKKGDLRHEGDS